MPPINVRSPGTVPTVPSTSPSTSPVRAPVAVSTPGVSRPADVFVPSTASASFFPPGPRRWGSWAWNTSQVTTPTALESLLAAQKSAGATELYFNAYPLLGSESFIQSAVTRSCATGLKPQLLLGSPEWIEPQTRPWLEKSIITPLKTIRDRVPAAAVQRLPVHLDVEPHATGPLTPQKMRDYLDTLSWFSSQLGPGFSLQVDIPAWYQGQKVDGKDFTQEILQRVDGVTLMAYERSAQQVLADVAPTLAQAAKLGKQAMVAVEVGPQYAQLGLGTQSEVRKFLAQLDAGLADKPGYGGCALHDLDKLRLLPL